MIQYSLLYRGIEELWKIKKRVLVKKESKNGG